MREKARIKRITALLEEVWSKHPDMRFGQLLINCNVIADSMLGWSEEDDKTEKKLKKVLEKGFPMRG